MSTGDTRQGFEELQQSVGRISDEARALGSTLETTIREAESYLRQHVSERPLQTLGIAAGIGYILGGGLPTRLTALVLALGSRMALEVAARKVTSRLAGGGEEARPNGHAYDH